MGHNRVHSQKYVAKNITPEMVKHVYELSASGIPQAEIAGMVNAKYGGDPEVTLYTVKNLLHRTAPFAALAHYRQIDEALHKAVASRLYGRRLKNRLSRVPSKQKPDTAVSPILDNVDQTASVLAGVLKARMEYDNALHRAEEIGLSAKAVKAWVSLATNGDLK